MLYNIISAFIAKFKNMRYFIIFIPIILSGCAAVATLGILETGKSAQDERSMGNIIDDAIITAKIKNHFAQTEFNELLSRISVSTTEGRVMLTGSVTKHEYIVDAVRLAWSIRGVKEVINELKVSNKCLRDRAVDTLIKKQIEAKFLLQKDFKSVNYTVDVNEGVVFLLGIAQDKAELDIALKIASNIKNVTKVVSHITLVGDPRRNDMLE